MKNVVKKMSLLDLKPHPLQSKVYTPCSEADNAALAEDLACNGQREAIPVMPPDNKAGLPADTMLDGHRRRAGLLANGQTEGNVLIRYDLKDADEATVTAEFIQYNLNRRQLHPLDKARAVQHLFLAKESRNLQHLSSSRREDLRDRIGETLNMSGRNLQRYLCVLQTPLQVQTALRDGKLSLVLASRVAALPACQQEELAKQIAGLAADQKANDLVSEFVDAPEMRHQRRISDEVRAFSLHVKNAVEAIEDRVDEIDPDQVRKSIHHFENGMKLIKRIMRRAS